MVVVCDLGETPSQDLLSSHDDKISPVGLGDPSFLLILVVLILVFILNVFFSFLFSFSYVIDRYYITNFLFLKQRVSL